MQMKKTDSVFAQGHTVPLECRLCRLFGQGMEAKANYLCMGSYKESKICFF